MIFKAITVNWKNLVENLIIMIVVLLVGVFIGHKLTKISAESTTEILAPLLEDAINKETISNSIYNAIDNNFEKIKKSDSLKIIIAQEPLNDQKPKNTFVKSGARDSCALTKNQLKKLSDSKQRRINRWVEEIN